MADPFFLARLLAASAMAVVLALCAGNAKSGDEPAQAQVVAGAVVGR